MSARAGASTMGLVEIRIVLDRVEPPAGSLRVLPGTRPAHGPGKDQEIRFTGWLGLLKALYEVTETEGRAHRPGNDRAPDRDGPWPGRPRADS